MITPRISLATPFRIKNAKLRIAFYEEAGLKFTFDPASLLNLSTTSVEQMNPSKFVVRNQTANTTSTQEQGDTRKYQQGSKCE